MAAFRTTRSPRPAAVVAVLTLLVAVTALLALSGTAHAADRTCPEFSTWEEAQAAFEADPVGLKNLDRNNNGVACEDRKPGGTNEAVTTTGDENDDVAALAAGSTTTTTSATATSTTTTSTTAATETTPTTPTSSNSNSDDDSDSDSDSDDSSSDTTDDKNCPDFASQADAQAALTAESGDPDNLDADDDGIACEDHFGEAGQQVQVHPTGGVDTGGA